MSIFSNHKHVIGITIWPGTSTDYLNDLLCSMLSKFEINNDINNVNISIITTKRTYDNDIFNIEKSTISDVVTPKYVKEEYESKNKYDVLNGYMCSTLNLGKHIFSKYITYNNLKIDIEFICDGMNTLNEYDNLCNDIKDYINKKVLKQNNLSDFLNSLAQMMHELYKNERYIKQYLVKQLDILLEIIKTCRNTLVEKGEIYCGVDSKIYRLFYDYSEVFIGTLDEIKNEKFETIKEETLSVIYGLIEKCNIKSVIKKFNELYYGSSDLHNLYGSSEHVSVMCSRNQFLRKHRNDFKMLCDDDDLTTGLNNYKVYFEYAEKIFNKTKGKISMIHYYKCKKNKDIHGMWSYVYLPTNTQLWNTVNFMKSEDVAFTFLHNIILKDVFNVNNLHRDATYNNLPLLYMYREASVQGYGDNYLGYLDGIYYYVTSILALKSKVGANILAIILYNTQYKNKKINIGFDSRYEEDIIALIQKFNNKLKKYMKTGKNKLLYELITRNYNIDFNTIYINIDDIINIKYNELIKNENNDEVYEKIIMDYNDEDKYRYIELFDNIMLEYTYLEPLFKNILSYIKKNKNIEDKNGIPSCNSITDSEYENYRPDTIVQFKDANKRYYDYITDNLQKLREESAYYDYNTKYFMPLNINRPLTINNYNKNLLFSDMYGGDTIDILKYLFIFIIIIIVIVIIIMIIRKIKINKNN